MKACLRVWSTDTLTMRYAACYEGPLHLIRFVDDRHFVTSSWRRLQLWTISSTGDLVLVRNYDNRSFVKAIALTADKNTVITGGLDGVIRFFDFVTGEEKFPALVAHQGSVQSLDVSSDGSRFASAGFDGSVRLWDLSSREPLATFIPSSKDNWLTFTPKGFFAGNQDSDMVAIAQGLEATSIRQLRQSLYNPDLVRMALSRDPADKVEYESAGKVTNLDKVVASGPPPEVEIVSTLPTSKLAPDVVEVVTRIKHSGKGIGRIEWRVNGITVGVRNAPEDAGREYEVTRDLSLDRGRNRIEVVAYNARNLLASLPAKTTIAFTGPTDTAKPKLHVLAIGINQYADRGWISPEGKPTGFGLLRLAVNDAVAIGAELEKAGAGLYSEVRVKSVLDRQARVANLDAVVTEMAAEIHPRDTFVFFAAGHGYSHQGRFYLIPQDYQGGTNPEALTKLAIDQARLQDWIANRIKAKNALILLDTCESRCPHKWV